MVGKGRGVKGKKGKEKVRKGEGRGEESHTLQFVTLRALVLDIVTHDTRSAT